MYKKLILAKLYTRMLRISKKKTHSEALVNTILALSILPLYLSSPSLSYFKIFLIFKELKLKLN